MKRKTQILLIHGGMTFKSKDYLKYLKTQKILLICVLFWIQIAMPVGSLPCKIPHGLLLNSACQSIIAQFAITINIASWTCYGAAVILCFSIACINSLLHELLPLCICNVSPKPSCASSIARRILCSNIALLSACLGIWSASCNEHYHQKACQ